MEYNSEQGHKWQSYWGLALGVFLGKQRQGDINAADFDYALAVVPGFMWQHSPELCGE